ncbi:MAG: metal ABC transporter permease [Phycisphaerales bacterium]|nr:metal ABC transporter permease [Phycisphaerales bacterium]
MSWEVDGMVILVGVAAALACALPGVFLVVRGMGLMGDAISHAVLPGIALGFLFSGSRESVWIFVGAAIAGVTAAVLTQVLHSVGRMERGAAIGTVFTVLFAIGLILMVRTADSVEIDPHCVLYGAIELVPLDTVAFGLPPVLPEMQLPAALGPILIVLGISAIVIALLWKELRLACFDPGLARTLGFNAGALHQVIMVLTAATCVACFEAVGSVMTVTFIVAPAATALLLSRRMLPVVMLALLLGGVAAVLGHISAVTVPGWLLGGDVDTSSSGMMAVAAGGLFLIAVFLAPGRGVIATRRSLRRLAATVAMEDALGLLYRLHERGEARDDAHVRHLLEADVRIGPRRLERVLRRLQQRALVVCTNGSWDLTEQGRIEAAGLVRAHRLWETWLSTRSSVPASHLHSAAERLEHVTDPDLASALQREVGDVDHDPHGRKIP